MLHRRMGFSCPTGSDAVSEPDEVVSDDDRNTGCGSRQNQSKPRRLVARESGDWAHSHRKAGPRNCGPAPEGTCPTLLDVKHCFDYTRLSPVRVRERGR